MNDRDLRRLKRRDLLKMLVVQCEETERLQQEAEQLQIRLREIEESYERLKSKLNVKDERLNQKDAKIAELTHTVEKLKTSKEIELKEVGSIAEAALQLNGIFEAAQRAADQYLMNVVSLTEAGRITQGEAARTIRSSKNRRPQDVRRKLIHG